MALTIFGCSSITKETQAPATVVTKPIKNPLIGNRLTIICLKYHIYSPSGCGNPPPLGGGVFTNAINKQFIATSIEVGENPQEVAIFYDTEILVPKIVFVMPTESGKLITSEVVGYMDSFDMINAMDKAKKKKKKKKKK